MSSTNHAVSKLRRLVAALVGLQVLIIAVNVLLVISGLFGGNADLAVGIAVAVLGLLLALALGFAALGLWEGKTWPRGLVITWQVLVAVVMATSLVTEWSPWSLLALAVALGSVVVIILDIRQEQSPALSEVAADAGTDSTGEPHS